MSAGCYSLNWTFGFVSVTSSVDWRWLFVLDLVLVLFNLLWVEERMCTEMCVSGSDEGSLV